MTIKPIHWMTDAQRINNREQVVDILIANCPNDPYIFELINQVNELRQNLKKET